MSSFHAAFSLGGFIGSLAVSLCAAAGLGPGATLLVAAGWVLLLTGGGAAIGLAVPAVAPVSPPAGARRDSARRVLLGLSALTFAAMLVEGGTADWSGVFLVTVAGAPIAAGAAVYGGFSIAMVVGRLLGDAVVRRLGRPMTLRAGAGLAAAGLALALAGATPLTGTIGFAIVGLGVANIIPTLFSAAARARPDAPGVGVSQAATLGYTGFLSGPPIIGAIADRIGLRLALVTLPVAVLAIVWRAGWAREPSIAEARE
jgi:fucose permease